MKTQRGDDNKEHLHQDLIIEILTKLPAKSLFKFRCVSKQWCSIIRSRSFINTFMSLSLSRPHLLLGYSIRRGDERLLLFLSSPLYPKDSDNSSTVTKHDIHDDGSTIPYDHDHSLVFCNSVRGITCVTVGDRLVLCNPTTRQAIRLPNDPTGLDPGHNTCFMFLGYDTSNDQYKILRGSWNQYDRSFEHSVCTFRVGEQSSFSSWRPVKSGNYSFGSNSLLYTKALCINGVVYYGAMDRASNYSFVIVSFDVGSERLVRVEVPEDDGFCCLINYQGKLACFYINDKSYRLRILDDVKKHSWSTKTGLLPPSLLDSFGNFVLRVCGATKAGEIILASSVIAGVLELFYYDLKKNNVSKRVRIGGITEFSERSISCDHVENIYSSFLV